MHDIDPIDPPPTDLKPASTEPGDEPEGADAPESTDADALLALLRILDGVRDDAGGWLVVWCADAMARDAALDGRSAGIVPTARCAVPVEETTIGDGWQGGTDRAACPGPGVVGDRPRRQLRRSRR